MGTERTSGVGLVRYVRPKLESRKSKDDNDDDYDEEFEDEDFATTTTTKKKKKKNVVKAYPSSSRRSSSSSYSSLYRIENFFVLEIFLVRRRACFSGRVVDREVFPKRIDGEAVASRREETRSGENQRTREENSRGVQGVYGVRF